MKYNYPKVFLGSKIDLGKIKSSNIICNIFCLNHIKNLVIYSLLLIIFQFQFTGCATMLALRKVDPPEKILKFDSICISEKNELTLNFTVRLKGGKKSENWCAKLPFEKVIQNSSPIDTSVPFNSNKMTEFFKSLSAISATNYTIFQYNCTCSNETIPYHNYSFGGPEHEIAYLRRNSSPIKIVLPSPNWVMDYGYVVFENEGSIEKRTVSKIELPLPTSVYDMKKIIMLPFCIIFDVAMTPVYLYVIIFDVPVM